MIYNDIISELSKIFEVNLSNEDKLYKFLGDSISMFRVIGKINKKFKSNIGMLDLIKSNTIKDLVTLIIDKTVKDSNNKCVYKEKRLPLTKMQEAYIIGQEQDFFGAKNSTHYYFEIKHSLNISRFNECIKKLLKRHEILRAFYSEEGYLSIKSYEEMNYKVDTTFISEEDEEEFFNKSRLESQNRIFKENECPLFYIKNINIGNKKMIAIIDVSLIILDGMSLKILLKDFLELYKGHTLENLNMSYFGYVDIINKNQNNIQYDIDKNFWQEKSSIIPIGPKLPLIMKINNHTNIYGRYSKTFTITQWNKLEMFSKQRMVSTNIVLLYAYLKTLERWSETHRFSVNVTVSNRSPVVEGIDKIVGDFTTNIIFDYETEEMKNLNEMQKLHRIRDKLYLYCDHNSYEGVEVIREVARVQNINIDALMPVVFTSMVYENDDLQNIDIVYSRSQTSQVYLDNQIHKNGDQFIIVWDYLEKIFDEHTISSMFNYYCAFIESCIRTNKLEVPKIEEEVLILNNKPIRSKLPTLDFLINEALSKYSHEVALKDDNNFVTYSTLKEITNKYISKFQKMGIKQGDRVIAIVDRNISSIAAIVSLVRMGAVYIPVPRGYPEKRINYIKEDSNSKYVVDIEEIIIGEKDTYEDDIVIPNIDSCDSAYVIYTSGSTGRPKGVEITHEGVVNTLLDINKRFDVTHNDKIIGISSLNFDLSIYDIFGAIISGGELLIVNDSRNIEEIAISFKNDSPSIWNSVPAFMEMFIDYIDEDYTNKSLRLVLLSGDWINVELPEKIKKHFPNAKIVSLGGATEASIWSIYYVINKVEKSWKSIPYGYALENQKIYILNENMDISPTDVTGEIYIGGLGVAVRYLGDEKKTEESFIYHDKLGRLYKTGDYGKLSKKGYIEFLGRKDKQIKIGGHRVELGEIQCQLNNYPEIKEAIVTVDSTKLIAYYKGNNIDSEKLKEYLSEELPYYMIPKIYIELEEFPLNENGKIDYKLLSEYCIEMEHDRKYDCTSHNTGIEKIMSDLWMEILNINSINLEDDFFSLGGNSITAQRLRQRIIDAFGVKIPLITIIREGTVKKLADIVSNNISKDSEFNKHLSNDKAVNFSPNYDNNNLNNEINWKKGKYPLTSMQLAYLNGQNDNFDLGKYTAHYYFEVETSYKPSKIEAAINRLIERHEALRTVFAKDGTQLIMEKASRYIVENINVSNKSEEYKLNENIKIREELSHKNYLHSQWPMFTIKTLELNEEKRILFISIDLMVCDGDSLQILLTELNSMINGTFNGSKLNYLYSDYIEEYRDYMNKQGKIEESKKYWMEKINNLSEYPQLPFKKSISLCKEYYIKRKHVIINKENWANLKKASKAKKISPSAVLCALYSKVLARWSNQSDLLLNMTVFQRIPFHKDVEHLIGDFTKLVALETYVDNYDLWSLAENVQKEIFENLEHINYDGTEVIKELAKKKGVIGKALMPIVFTCILFDSPVNWFKQFGELKYAISQTPQVLLDNQIIEMQGELNISWDYVDELFEDLVIDTMFDEFVFLINNVVRDETIFNNEMIKNKKIWYEYNASNIKIENTTLQKLFKDQVIKKPCSIAITYNKQNYTYEYIDKESNKVTRYLLDNNCFGKENRIAVLARRTPETIILILGILKAGGTYVPISTDFPEERQQYIVSDSKCSLFLDDNKYISEICNKYSDSDVEIEQDENSLAYIIYTSGSTGKPKGVMIQHKSVCNTIVDLNNKIGLTSDDTIMGISSISFDLSVYDMFGTFSKGGRLVIINDPRDMSNISKIVQEEKVTIWNSVPIIFDIFCDYIINNVKGLNSSLRTTMLSGDWIPIGLPDKSRRILGDIDFISLGGATEASIWSIYYPVETMNVNWKSIPYGIPLGNQKMYILDYNQQLCPYETKGEIYIGGAGLSSGYVNDKEKTENAFIDHPKLGRLYKTGDLGVLKKEGYIEFLGREDNQVKIRGYRVELGEIESELIRIKEIKDAVVIFDKNVIGKNQIIAYVVGIKNKVIDVNTVKEKLAKKLPKYMIPTNIIQVSKFTLTSNGKIDRNNLPKAIITDSSRDNVFKESTDEEEKLLDIWKEVFGITSISLKDDFFSIGGDSILLMRMVDKINASYEIEISLEDILESESISELSKLISGKYSKATTLRIN